MKNIAIVLVSMLLVQLQVLAKETAGKKLSSLSPATETAIFAGGCFWCMEPPFDKLKGVIDTTSGYSGGDSVNPTYEEVSKKDTDHREVIRITFDPKKVTYAELLEVFWKNIDPYDDQGQFCDKGNHYKSAIYYQNETQKSLAEASKAGVAQNLKIKQPIVTEIMPGKIFYEAEKYHQDYYTKNPIRYKYYRSRCGRDQRLKELWRN